MILGKYLRKGRKLHATFLDLDKSTGSMNTGENVYENSDSELVPPTEKI